MDPEAENPGPSRVGLDQWQQLEDLDAKQRAAAVRPLCPAPMIITSYEFDFDLPIFQLGPLKGIRHAFNWFDRFNSFNWFALSQPIKPIKIIQQAVVP